MKTIVIQLLKTMALRKDEYYRIMNDFHGMKNYAPDGVYNYYIIGGRTVIATLNPDLLTSDLIPMLKEFYSEYGHKEYSQQYDAVLQELNKLDAISSEICEELGYRNAKAFYPVFINDAVTRPFLMNEDGVRADCTGIVLCAIPPEVATFSMLYTLEEEIQNKLSAHKLAKALKVCVMEDI